MPKQADQKAKILDLLRILRERTDETHGLSMSELIAALAEYGITAERRSIYDDIAHLRQFGLEILTRRTATTEYYLASRIFEAAELKLLVDAIQSSRFITHRKSRQLIGKLEGLTSRYEAQSLQRQVYVTNRIKTVNEHIYYNIDRIHAAIASGRKISFRYFRWIVDETGHIRKEYRHSGYRYVISPWALTWEDENYYLIGYDSKAGVIKHYRVDKMESMAITKRPREGEDHFQAFDMALYAKKVFGMFGGAETTVRLRFAKDLIGVVIDRFGEDVPLQTVTDDDFQITVSVVTSPQFFSWLFAFGDKVQILSPAEVIQAFQNQLQAAQRAYTKPIT